ncbi:dihydrodipicolinate synthase family protein [Tunicatimonas pelagia]|uniref:dihydrodipicolinate synthase family protein n=1 Tax=Tunicatimonas pelagia TaxID=931531 RepID=UPI0026665849|nr:dihydrodipicolinate synthase family protein [Tunicatimonas pelagia]WKN42768.1 dihydrodipicolinate synthase family protein [Tunicatimonas pelagia]
MLKTILLASYAIVAFNFSLQAQGSARQQYVQKLYNGDPVPKLWVPLLSHFKEDGVTIDVNRTKKHLQNIAPNIGGVLIPGSTGEGWEMSLLEQLSLLKQVLPLLKEKRLLVSIGILRTSSEGVLIDLETVAKELMAWSGEENLDQALDFYHIKGFTICNPKGKSFSQHQLIAYWEQVLARNLPTIFYQLPQVTGNELNRTSLVYLSGKYPNLYMVKDTSGEDELAKARENYGDLFFVRGYEGKYYKQLKKNGGYYDGLLLGTANVFSKELSQVIELSENEAKRISIRLDKIIQPTFNKAGKVSYSNAFTITNKAFDHFKAYGMQYPKVEIQTLYNQRSIPLEIVLSAYHALAEAKIHPSGYLNK